MSAPGWCAVPSRRALILLAVGLLALGCGDRSPKNDITDQPDADTMAAAPGSPDATPDTPLEAGIERITIGDRTFRLELAATPPYRNPGLMYRRAIDDDGGMLFVLRGYEETRPQQEHGERPDRLRMSDRCHAVTIRTKASTSS